MFHLLGKLRFSALGLLLGITLAHATGIWTNVSGTWHQVTDPEVNVSGTYHQVQQGWVNVSGTWHEFYVRATYSAGSGGSYTDTYSGINPTTITLGVDSGGAASITGVNSGTLASWDWITPTTSAGDQAYQAEFLVSSGSVSGSATGVNVPISGSPAWSVSNGSMSSVDAVGTLYIKDAAGNVLSSASYTLTAGPV